MTALRDRLAAPVVIVYWLALVLGLLLYSAIRIDTLWLVVPIWIGVLGGTALGQCLALRDYRLWLIACIVAGATLWGAMFDPSGLDTKTFWMAFVPAALCGALSLADRWSLAAFWLPVVLWMLSILDDRVGATALAGSGAVLIAGLALVFIGFLYVRESRRIGLWRAVSTAPLATPHAPKLLSETPGAQLGRTSWGLFVSMLAFAFTAWIAPKLWQVEALDHTAKVTSTGSGDGGMPCCPTVDVAAKRSRVREYFDLGRGREDRDEPPPCVVCRGDGELAYGEGSYRPGGDYDATGFGAGGGTAGGTGGAGGAGGSIASDPSSSDPSEPNEPTFPSERPVLPTERPTEATPIEPQQPIEQPVAPPIQPELIQPPPDPPTEHPPAEQAAEPAIEPPATPKEPDVPGPVAAPVTEPPTAAQAPVAGSAPAMQPQPRQPVDGSPLLRWLAVLLAGALAYQVLSLGLRPVRRLITLRHLRNPFWSETIDQRVSNFWQLVLVGLRDGGWRTSSGEPPVELARRVGIAGVERCATILERTRHGIALDAGDLAEMGTSAEAAYRSGRNRVGPLARALAWLRWPLT